MNSDDGEHLLRGLVVTTKEVIGSLDQHLNSLK